MELPDATGDDAYLTALSEALPHVWNFEPQLILFQSGVDALGSDRLGHLQLTVEGLQQRDTMVISQTKAHGMPLVITLGGGYSDPIELTVEAHAQTFRTAGQS